MIVLMKENSMTHSFSQLCFYLMFFVVLVFVHNFFVFPSLFLKCGSNTVYPISPCFRSKTV